MQSFNQKTLLLFYTLFSDQLRVEEAPRNSREFQGLEKFLAPDLQEKRDPSGNLIYVVDSRLVADTAMVRYTYICVLVRIYFSHVPSAGTPEARR